MPTAVSVMPNRQSRNESFSSWSSRTGVGGQRNPSGISVQRKRGGVHSRKREGPLWVSSGHCSGKPETGGFRPDAAGHSSRSALSQGYFPNSATNKKIKPAKKLANRITSGLRTPFCIALKAIAANPSIPITPLTTRMNGEILSFLLRISCLSDEGRLRVSGRHPSAKHLGDCFRPIAVVA